jgi:hypothetical protein
MVEHIVEEKKILRFVNTGLNETRFGPKKSRP